MKRPLEGVRLGELLSDAMAGEFQAGPDPQQIHVLSRLALRTFEAGDVSTHLLETDRNPHETYRYSPSWAPDVNSILVCRVGGSGLRQVIFLGLLKNDSNGYRIRLKAGTNLADEQLQGLQIAVPELDIKHDFPSDLSVVSEAREKFTETAAEFFAA